MWDTSFLSTVIMWFLNGIIVAVVLAKLFIYGEPVTHKNSEASVAYWRHRNQAEQDSSRVGFLHVIIFCVDALNAIGETFFQSRDDFPSSCG